MDDTEWLAAINANLQIALGHLEIIKGLLLGILIALVASNAHSWKWPW